jgi:sulfur-carrier protein
MVTVRLDAGLSQFLKQRTLSSRAGSVDALLDDIERRYPTLRHRLRDETRVVRRYVRVFVNGEDIRALAGPKTPLSANDSVDILHSIQGG